MDALLDVSLDGSLGASLDVSFGFKRNTCSTGYTTFASLALTGARQARIEDFGATRDGDDAGGDRALLALRSSPRSMPRSI
jgi:hypothetical protein